MNDQPIVAIVLLNYNGKNFMRENLPYVTNVTYPNTKTVVIDNCSKDDSIEFLRANYPSIEIISLTENSGYAGGYNKGLSQIKADYFILLNTDVKVTSGFIEPLLNTLQMIPSAGICQPKILSLENPHSFEYAGAAGGFMDKWGYIFTQGRILETVEVDDKQYNTIHEIFWASGACFIIKSSLFKKLNGFYDYFFMYSEEIDLCWRAQLINMKIYCNPESVVYHRETTAFMKLSEDRIYYVFRNNLIMLIKNLSLHDKLKVIPIRLCLNIVAAFLFLIRGYPKKFFIILKSIISVTYWAATTQENNSQKKRNLKLMRCVFQGNILAEYYFFGRRKFFELNMNKLNRSEKIKVVINQ